MVISILLLALPIVSALDFSFSAPEKINAEEEFTISISANENSQEIYDVKAFVHAHTKQHSEIFYDNAWKSPFNYISSAFPSQTEFKLKSHYIGKTKVCVRLRQTGNSTFEEKCNEIEVLSAELSSEESENEKTEIAEQEEQTIAPPKQEVAKTNFPAPSQNQIKQEKIILNVPSSANSLPENVSSEKSLQWTKYALMSLLLLVIIFLILRKL